VESSGEIKRVLVCGGRRYADRDILYDCLSERLAVWDFLVLIHGDAEGADRLAHAWALEHGVQPAACRANWPRWPRAAGSIRNDRMLVLQPQACIAFPGGRGTDHMVQRCESASMVCSGPMRLSIQDTADQSTMKTRHPEDEAPLCKECIRARQELMTHNVTLEQATTVADGIRMALRNSQHAFQELTFQLAHVIALARRAFQVLTGRAQIDDTLIGHMKNMDLADQPPEAVIPPGNCSAAQLHVYCNVWLRLNELVRLDPRAKSAERLELQLLQQLMNFYQRGAFPQLEHGRRSNGR
jgi:YspA, cpYpsA-related SLOG family